MTKQKRALVVEDNALAQNTIRFILDELGWMAPIAVSRGRQALLLMEKEVGNLNLIILDQGLPDIPGLELLAKMMKRFGKMPPVIMITGNYDPTLETEARALGVAAFVMKHELSFDKIEELITRIIDHS